jgi:putative transposase
MPEKHKQRLKRLPAEYYRGHAWVHWTLTIENRKTGWLDARFLYKFRELLTHAMFRYQLACPIYCLMPDHAHLLWTGVASDSNQLTAMKAFRMDVNEALGRIGFQLQSQGYDHVLKDEEVKLSAIESAAEYIARNPERRRFIDVDAFATYPFTGCLLPGAARLRLFTETGWDEVWRTLAFLKRTECFRRPDPKYE